MNLKNKNPCASKRPAWIEIDLDAITDNISTIKSYVEPKTAVMAVVKANAYGHGLIPATFAALRGGATAIGVALLEEGLELRSHGIEVPIVILGCGLPEQAETLVAAGLSQTVSDKHMLCALSQAACTHKTQAKIHLKIDTGMGRVGITPEESGPLAKNILTFPRLVLEGIATHIGWEKFVDLPKATRQIHRFGVCLQALGQAGLKSRWRHAANSLMTLEMPITHYNLVRIGLLAYGIRPSSAVPNLILRPALTLKARITQLRTMNSGQTLSYGGTFTLKRPSKVALIPLGYADGYPRTLSNKAEVLISGHRCPIIGAICMDQLLVDVTDLSQISTGDEVTLLGRSGSNEITVLELAKKMKGIPHEVVSQLNNRLPRIWKNSKIV